MLLSENIINWYSTHARKLPWRQNQDPYSIWVSEIIMQQTRIEQGLAYYLRFIETFPNIMDLAKAKEDKVLKLWEGLGYYSRARHMMHTAKEIASLYNGVFPKQYETVLKLKGIGPYTASAICSFAYKKPYAVVDGNVSRVLSRYYGINTPINTSSGKSLFAKLAQDNLNLKSPDIHNQAIMEFGALQCKPTNPLCLKCPVADSCVALATNQVSILPKKEKNLKVSNRYLHFFFIKSENYFLVEKRTSSDIWKGLYQLPLIESKKEVQNDTIFELTDFKNIIGNQKFNLVKTQEVVHKLTHRKLYIRFYNIEVTKLLSPKYLRIAITNMNDIAYPQPVRKFLTNLAENILNN